MGKNAILKPILIGALILAVAGGIAFAMFSGGDEKPEKSAVSHKKEHTDMANEQNEPQESEDKGTARDYEANSNGGNSSSALKRNTGYDRRAGKVVFYNRRHNQKSVSREIKHGAGTTPSVSPSKPDINPGVNPGEQTPPVLDRTAQVEKEISSLMRTADLKDGTYVGLGNGFDEAKGGVKTIVTIKNNNIENIEFVEGQGYSGMDYKTISSRVIPFLYGKSGKRNIAILKVYRKYIDQIAAAKDHAKEAEKLLGKEYASKISDPRRAEMVSPVIREYLGEHHKCKEMMDAVSGATLTTGGIGLSVDNALELSEHDKKTGNEITDIKVLEPTEVNQFTGQRLLKTDVAKPLDLSGIKVELTKTDGTKIEVPYAEFDKYGIEVTNKDTGEKLYDKMNLPEEVKKQALIATITHKGSKRHTELAIFFESYSNDYIVKMEYSFDDGKTWEEVKDPVKSEENKNNISYRQTVKIKKEYLGKNARFRTTSVSGKHYEYECKFPVNEYGFKFSFNAVNKDYEENKNANFALYITFKEDVNDEDPGTGGDEPGEETEEVGEDEMDAVFAAKNLNHKNIAAVPVRAGDGVTVEDVEGLPDGLSYSDGVISGKIDIADGEFQGITQKEYSVKLIGIKDEKDITRTVKLVVYQDKDRDGYSAVEEGIEGDNEFTPNLTSRIINKKSGDAEPTLDEYKALISNLPSDGSVKLEVLDHPDMSDNGYTLVKIRVTSIYASKESIISIGVSVS